MNQTSQKATGEAHQSDARSLVAGVGSRRHALLHPTAAAAAAAASQHQAAGRQQPETTESLEPDQPGSKDMTHLGAVLLAAAAGVRCCIPLPPPRPPLHRGVATGLQQPETTDNSSQTSREAKIYAPRCGAAGGDSRRALLHPAATAAAAATSRCCNRSLAAPDHRQFKPDQPGSKDIRTSVRCRWRQQQACAAASYRRRRGRRCSPTSK